ncbi:MAG TPA: hypothetical protein VMR33_20535 [Candidatus Baltobacteraceae bacterium]|nr:hypothetical protein [Candidatus Baltobacteraceae bacterium]
MFKSLAVLLLSGATTFAGSFTNSDFSNTSLYTLNQVTDTGGNVYPVVTNSALLLLANEGSIGPNSIVLNDLDTNLSGGIAIDSFTATFDLQIGPASSTPADGFAFVFGPDVVSTTVFSEAGPAMPDGGVSVAFITYAGDTPGIGVTVKVLGDGGDDFTGVPNGGFVPMNAATMADSQMHPVTIQVNRNGTLNMVWNGNTIFTNFFLTGWAPVYGQFAIGGRNGGDSEQVVISNLDITTVQEPTPAVAPIVTSQPQGTTITEGTSASFSVGFDGDAPITFQWTETLNNVLQDLPNATNSTLLLTEVSYTNNGAQIACILSNPTGSTNTQAAILTVTPDKTPPTVSNAVPDFTFTNVVVTFSKPVSDTALNIANYAINKGVTVVSAIRVNQSTVALGTTLLSFDTSYVLTINGVQDTAATPNTIAPDSQITFLTFAFQSGAILHKVYFPNPSSPWYGNENGSSITQLLADPRYPNNPDRVDLAQNWEWPPDCAGTTLADTNKSMFYDSLEGYFYPPATGDYVLYTCGDDEFYLFLSTNASPANMQLVAEETGGWGNCEDWTNPVSTSGGESASGFGLSWNSATFSGTTWPTGNTISLTKGQPYYMIMFHHDHNYSGGDQLQTTYEGPSDTNAPANGSDTQLTGNVIGFDFNPAGVSLVFNQTPVSVTNVEGTWSWFTTAATGTSIYGTNVQFQWQIAPAGSSVFTNASGLPGSSGLFANSPNFESPILALTDNGMQVQVVASMPPISATSAVASVTVVPNTALVISAGAIEGTNADTVTIGVGFSATVDDTAGSNPANYSISSGTITGFLWATNRFTADSAEPHVMVRKQGAMLTVSGFTGGTVTVKNQTDVYGNTVASTNIPVTVNTNMAWGVVGANSFGGWNAVVPVATNGFDLYSDGTAEWGTYDEATFVYEQVTGDFDKKLRVEYQDGSEEWARAGLIARDVLNFGVNSATQTGSGNTAPPYDGTAGRYQKCYADPIGPTLTGPGTDGNGVWEGNRRLDTGSATTTAVTNVDILPPMYPHPWCRIQRQGQTFNIYSSEDGVNWELLGTTTWGPGGDAQTTNLMPATMYVGPEYSPENGNVSDVIDQGTFLAQFRDYGDYVSATLPTLSAAKNADGTFTLTYTGTLQSSTNLAGPYSAVPAATSPLIVNPTTTGAPADMFYRAGP